MKIKKQRGQVLIAMIIMSFVIILFITGLASWAASSIKVSQKKIAKERAFQIAEAGIEYYRWHLAHYKDDYYDGQTWCCQSPPCGEWCGVYSHDYYDKDENLIGHFNLQIKPPLIGSTLVTIKSEGRVNEDLLVKRTIAVEMAIPSLAKYAVAANDKMRFGQGTEVFGLIHSNDGLRFDGLAHNIVSSSKADYDDPDHTGNNEFGVHTHVNPPPGSGVDDSFRPLEAPPNSPQNRTDVFMTGRQFPVPAIDFTGMIADLASIKSSAQQNGLYFAASGYLGYRILLKNNGTLDLYQVTSIYPKPSPSCTSSQDGWGTWSIENESLLGNYAFPANGLIFVEDNLWIEGQINTARLTIASGKFPEDPTTSTSITINNDLKYTNYDGQDIIGLVAQKNINVGLYSEDNLQLDAALIAKNGRVGRYYYNSNCGSSYIRQIITLNGMIATNQRYGFAYTDSTGYQTRVLNYDGNLLYGPPPSFPLTSDQYVIISWREIK